ncbi:MAG: hypothetical protein FJY95_22085 [Candidatus Handelsmanbacteria bacterium]|nr:hypothetical protein [Candidatus Handelsmanbacteria bacterium]
MDLVCADGLYAEAGYPVGRTADPRGNLRDATDPFDGVRFTRFDLGSNPLVNVGGILPAASAGLSLKLQLQDGELWVNVARPRGGGVIL